MHKKAIDNRIFYLGSKLLTKTHALKCNIYIFKAKPALKTRKRTTRVRSKYRKSHKEPWLLATSLSGGVRKSSVVLNNYKKRMKIEHEFRDLKDEQWGIGLSYTRTRNHSRLAVLLLISTLAIFSLWVIGLTAERMKLHYHYQANTVKNYRVLSLVFLALQVIMHDMHRITRTEIYETLRNLQQGLTCGE